MSDLSKLSVDQKQNSVTRQLTLNGVPTIVLGGLPGEGRGVFVKLVHSDIFGSIRSI